MIFSRIRGFVLVCGVAMAVLAVPAQSKAFDCLNRLFGWCCGGSQTTYQAPYAPTSYAPAYTPAYSSAYTPQTCCYVPQTCYRTVLVPYTTYRLVCSYSCAPCSTACGTACGVGCGIASPCATGVYGAVSPGCATCAPASSAPYSAPLETKPQLDSATPKTFDQPEQKTETEKKTEALKPIPIPNTSSAPALKLIQPENRTTRLPGRQAMHYQPVTFQVPVKNARAVPAVTQRVATGIGVWRASSD